MSSNKLNDICFDGIFIFEFEGHSNMHKPKEGRPEH